jgi:hypothetical protein
VIAARLRNHIKADFIHPFAHKEQTQSPPFSFFQRGVEGRSFDLIRIKRAPVMGQDDGEMRWHEATYAFHVFFWLPRVGMLHNIAESLIDCHLDAVDIIRIKKAGFGCLANEISDCVQAAELSRKNPTLFLYFRRVYVFVSLSFFHKKNPWLQPNIVKPNAVSPGLLS